jgi:hypothetical protein
LWTNEGIFVKFGLKNACARHVFKFLSTETENANGMAKLKIFETSLGAIDEIETMEQKLQIAVNFRG